MNYFLFALRNLKRKGIRSWLTLLGICIGIMAVVSLISLGNGLNAAVMSQFGVSSTEVITVQAGGLNYGSSGSDVVNPLTENDVRAINGLTSVDYAFGENTATGKLEYNNILVVGSVSSVDVEYYKEYYEISEFEAEYGRLLKEGDSGKIVLGASFYDGKTNGFERTIVPGKKVLINNRTFEVVGILKKTGSFISDGIVFMSDADLESISNQGDVVDTITVKVKNKDLMDKAKSDIEKLLRERRDVEVGSEDFSVSTPESSLEQINQILGAIQAFVIIIASISIVIGVVGIVNTMFTSVLERRKEIGIMKSVGAKNSQIFAQFFIESGFLGFIGGGIGVLLGVALGYIGTILLNSFLGSDTQPQISFSLIFFSLFGSFLIGSLAGVFPAMKAAKQNPVQALSNS
ncbi:ABC transporter permease [Candidatus Pacearchaeota archaeon]|jgi:putative ABC transport system permease protein|nr:ABC transporter permease [Candidatus Pacearchaeota archaeon]